MVKDILSMKPSHTSQMPELLSKPPVDDLLQFEKKCRMVNTVSGLQDLLAEKPLAEYWNDWRLILASHRALKISGGSAQRDLLAATSFGGYSFFNK
jgi:hypothetical protein